MAILLALSSPKLKVIGLTITHGNLAGEAGIEQLARNAARLLCLTKNYHVPVIKGEHKPLDRIEHTGGAFIHGTDGQGDIEGYLVEQDDLSKVQIINNAPQWIVDTLLSWPVDEPLPIIFSLGPMTNLGKALRIEPRIASRAELYAMGGSFHVHGNISPNAEANVYNDPEAADLCLSNFHSVHLCPLDVTTRIPMNTLFTVELATISPFLGEFIRRTVVPYLAFHVTAEGKDSSPVHDSSAVAAYLWPELFVDARTTWVRVECGDGLCRGVTVGDFRTTTQNVNAEMKKNVVVHFNVNSVEFLRLYKEAIASLEKVQ